MHSDLLDTVLVSRKDPPAAADSAQGPAPPQPNMSDPTTPTSDDEAKCPVDHKTRETWLQQARAQNPHGALPNPHAAVAQPPAQPTTSTWSSWLRNPFSSAPQPSPPAPSPQKTLDESRIVSSIPRASSPSAATPTARPSNHELETGASPSGNWIYPSEKMFFEAMKRKGFDHAQAQDMKTVVPIHNAVNERAWAEILRWEAPYVEKEGCGGPRLHSFAGLSERMSPKARMNTLLGYTAPFDRHDWVVDRCGKEVEYIIDFYAGRGDGSGKGKLNFYLDVRPKLNSWEGVKMRVLRGVGLV
ncbi:hypothetical protein OQA88_11849 [Cercophora sp. LCS_1]